MWELSCKHRLTGKTYYILLLRPRYLLGKGLRNDILFLDAATPLRLGSIERHNRSYVWKGHKEQNLREGILIGNYQIKIRRWYGWIHILLSLALLIGATTFFFKKGTKETVVTKEDLNISNKVVSSQHRSPENLVEVAKKLLSERAVRPGNLVRAIQYLELAKNLYLAQEKFFPKYVQDIYLDALGKKREMIRKFWLVAEKSRSHGDLKKYRKAIKALLSELIDPRDPDRLEIEKEFSRLSK